MYDPFALEEDQGPKFIDPKTLLKPEARRKVSHQDIAFPSSTKGTNRRIDFVVLGSLPSKEEDISRFIDFGAESNQNPSEQRMCVFAFPETTEDEKPVLEFGEIQTPESTSAETPSSTSDIDLDLGILDKTNREENKKDQPLLSSSSLETKIPEEGKDGLDDWEGEEYDGESDSCDDEWEEKNSSQKPRNRSTVWTKEEDAIILKLKSKSDRKISWVQIAEHLPGRSSHQCYQRYTRVISPQIDASPFRPEELIQIEREYNRGSRQWAKISRLLEGRTGIQCKFQMDRLTKSANRKWTESEDDFIRVAIAALDREELENDQTWVCLSESLNRSAHNRSKAIRRTSLDCLRRWKEITNPKREVEQQTAEEEKPTKKRGRPKSILRD